MHVARILVFFTAVSLSLACDVSDTLGCTGTFLKESALTIFNNQDKFCSKVNDYIYCIKRACPSGLPQENIDTIHSTLKNLNLSCDLSLLNGTGKPCSLSPLMTVAFFFSLILFSR